MAAQRTANRGSSVFSQLLLLVVWSAKHMHAAERTTEAENALDSLRSANRQLRVAIGILEHVYAEMHRPADRPIVNEISVAHQLASALTALLLPRMHTRRVLSADELRGGALPM